MIYSTGIVTKNSLVSPGTPSHIGGFFLLQNNRASIKYFICIYLYFMPDDDQVVSFTRRDCRCLLNYLTNRQKDNQETQGGYIYQQGD